MAHAALASAASTDAGQCPTTADFGWFGKLPSAGDFVSRRMSYTVQQFWDRWCASGMESLKAGNPLTGWEFWRNTPKWAFLIPAQPGIAQAQAGVLAPSCDRVGRNFPLLVCLSLASDKTTLMMPRLAALVLAWADVIAEVQFGQLGINVLDERLEAALARVLALGTVPDDAEKTLPRGANPAVLPWPDLASTFDPTGSESYWWSVPPAKTGFHARTHADALDSMHFLSLCN